MLFDGMLCLTKQKDIRELLSSRFEKPDEISYNKLAKKINHIILIENLEEVFPSVVMLSDDNVKLLLALYRGINCLSYHLDGFKEVYARVEVLAKKYKYNEIQKILQKEGFIISKNRLKELLYYYCGKNQVNYKKIDSKRNELKLLNVSKEEWEELVRNNSSGMILHKLNIGVCSLRSNIKYHGINVEKKQNVLRAYTAELSKIKKGEFFENRPKFLK